jgi:hypothetical protein
MEDYGTIRRHVWAIPLEIVMLGGVVITFSQGNWKHFAASIFTLLVSFLPLLLERWLRIKLPSLLQVAYVGFVFASFFTGEVLHMYARIHLWDDAMHFMSGFLIGLGIILWLGELARRNKRYLIPVWFEALFVFCMSVMIITVWEIIEFSSDQLFGTFSQGADLFDTMIDLVYGSVGSLVMALLWVVHKFGHHVILLSRIISRFALLNTPASRKSS